MRRSGTGAGWIGPMGTTDSKPLIWIAPTEPASLKSLGKVGMLPETMGVDVYWKARGANYGVQRKELGDLLSSVGDGRLGKELAQMRAAGMCGLLAIEGSVSWTSDGQLNRAHAAGWTYARWFGLIAQVQFEFGVGAIQTRNLSETVRLVETFYAWSLKDRHGSLQGRPAPKGLWGSSPTNEDFAVHVLTAIPGIGPVQAKAIFDASGGRIPLTMDVPWSTLEGIRGLGPKKIQTLKKLFQRENESND